MANKYQLLIGLEKLLIGLRILTRLSPLTRTKMLYVIHKILIGLISLKIFFYLVDHFMGSIPTRFSPWLGFS